MVRTFLWLATLLAATSISLAQDKNTKQILTRFDAIRPSANELAMYRLDWAKSLDEALQRSAAESRPVFLVVIHAKYGDISSGHC